MSIKRSYSARVQRRVRTGYVAMKGTLRQAARDVNVADSDTLADPSYGCGSRGRRSRQIAAPDATLPQPGFGSQRYPGGEAPK